MLNDFQDTDTSAAFLDELDDEEFDDDFNVLTSSSSGRLFGMTPPQRLVISVLVFGITCILSTFCLLIFDKISPPF
ncbi:MAG: hypothetical protein FVQ83_09050 [Chloroflexi bacterium]|nr:hypothetical protein [Chloroflexota bacterium]